ncbi:MAG: M1 family metallopeptidase [Bacteroidales bacterium]|nr:M1 family metallopeptidase [Bacteroidales bacterium]
MIRNSALILVFIILCQFGLSAQTAHRFISRNFQEAVEKQTRTFKGVPGPDYWQNKANYVIEAAFDPSTAKLNGLASIVYFNNSPDTLDKIVFNLYQDIFREGNSRDWDLGGMDITKGTNIKSLAFNDIKVDLLDKVSNQRQGTKLISKLNNKLLPNDSLRIHIAWEVSIPVKRPIRMGKYNDSTWFIAYWYPQLAVYDDMDGWDMISYNGSVEFYNDFNDYEVNITVPKDYVLWAGAKLLNPADVFNSQIVNRIEEASSGFEIKHIITEDDYKKFKITNQTAKNTWKFASNNVPDFSFGIGLGKQWDMVKLLVDSVSNRTVIINSVYTPENKHFNKVAQFALTSVSYMSYNWPGLAFPYPQVTVFCDDRTGGGMESPMMANNSAPDDEADAFGLTFHEIAHSYFPFYMGTNEKKYAFMDEGWASYLPTGLVDSLYPDHTSLKWIVKKFEENAGYEFDTPPMVLNQLMGANYQSLRLASYTRPSLAYNFLKNAIGVELFKLGLQNYMKVWAGKHPTPNDFFTAMELTAGQDLNWFIRPWFYDFAYPDLALRKVTKDGIIVIENVGGLPLPVELNLLFTDGSKLKIEKDASIWSSGEKSVIIEFTSEVPLQEIDLGSDLIPDSNKKSNKMLFID